MEPATLLIIEKIANRLAPKYTFGFYDLDDIKQEIFLLALDGIKQYDETRGTLGTFLFQFVNSRIKNFKRDNYFRAEFKCVACDNLDPHCDKCLKRHWKASNKRQLLETQDIHIIDDDSSIVEHFNYLDNLADKEILEYIDSHIPVSMRDDYLKMKENIYVHKQKRAKIEEFITCLLKNLK
jgi:DNA-directed RNA polymerase specialized sigma24 family protein